MTANTHSQDGAWGNEVLARLQIPLPSKNPGYRLRYEAIRKLREDVGGYSKMEQSGMPKAEIEKIAGELSRKIHFSATADLGAFIRAIGGRFSFVTYGQIQEDDGSIFVHEDKEFDIVLPDFISPLRNRFTMAHELGHYLLHQPKEMAYAQRKGSNRVEHEANWFAAGFLMPEPAFRDAALTYGSDPIQLSYHFGVSRDAADIRMRSLGLL